MALEFFSLVALIPSPLSKCSLIVDTKQTPRISLIALVPWTKWLKPTVSRRGPDLPFRSGQA